MQNHLPRDVHRRIFRRGLRRSLADHNRGEVRRGQGDRHVLRARVRVRRVFRLALLPRVRRQVVGQDALGAWLGERTGRRAARGVHLHPARGRRQARRGCPHGRGEALRSVRLNISVKNVGGLEEQNLQTPVYK